ncbi:MAG: TetR/AcrR family transcriptional regulator [Thermodesulfobacteriota bacterium]
MMKKNIQEKRRKQILEALHKRLLIKPYDRTSIKEIASEAGLNHGMLHYYFKSKEDILLAYIDYTIDLHRDFFVNWFSSNVEKLKTPADLIYATFDFMTQKITLNRELSKVFIEIWEIALYNNKVRSKLQKAYGEWITIASEHLSGQMKSLENTKELGLVVVAFSEGLSLLSVILKKSEVSAEVMVNIFKEAALLYISKNNKAI